MNRNNYGARKGTRVMGTLPRSRANSHFKPRRGYQIVKVVDRPNMPVVYAVTDGKGEYKRINLDYLPSRASISNSKYDGRGMPK